MVRSLPEDGLQPRGQSAGAGGAGRTSSSARPRGGCRSGCRPCSRRRRRVPALVARRAAPKPRAARLVLVCPRVLIGRHRGRRGPLARRIDRGRSRRLVASSCGRPRAWRRVVDRLPPRPDRSPRLFASDGLGPRVPAGRHPVGARAREQHRERRALARAQAGHRPAQTARAPRAATSRTSSGSAAAALRDEWFPYVLAFGLDGDAQDWFRRPRRRLGRRLDDVVVPLARPSSELPPSSGPDRLERRRRRVRRRRRHGVRAAAAEPYRPASLRLRRPAAPAAAAGRGRRQQQLRRRRRRRLVARASQAGRRQREWTPRAAKCCPARTATRHSAWPFMGFRPASRLQPRRAAWRNSHESSRWHPSHGARRVDGRARAGGVGGHAVPWHQPRGRRRVPPGGPRWIGGLLRRPAGVRVRRPALPPLLQG